MMITETLKHISKSTENKKILLTHHNKVTKTMVYEYLQSSKLENFENITKMLKNISEENIRVDDIGKYFESSLDQVERKKKGQYYTSPTIVQYMINLLSIKDSSKTLDPTCGCGSFTLGLYDHLEGEYGKSSFRNVFGVDLNPIAVDITRLCLFLKSNKKHPHHSILQKNIQVGNSIISNNNFNWNVNFKSILDNGGFDFVIGNPPYGTIGKNEFDLDDSEYSKIINGAINIASLLIVKSLNLLKEGGKLAFLLPKSILHVNSYRYLRKYILEKSTVLQICDLGQEFLDVRGEQIILFLQKTSNSQSKPKKVKISIGITKNSDEQIKPKQEFYINYSALEPDKFPVLDNLKHYRILNKLNAKYDTVSLSEFVNGQIFRGITLNAEQQKTISERHVKNGIKILRGRSISKYKISTSYYVKKIELSGKNHKKIQNLYKKQKIVLQNIFSSESGIIASFDHQGIMTLDTVTNVIVDNSNIGKYLLGLFNSKLINFYLMFGLFNRSKLTMHVDKKYLGSIPIVNNPDVKIMKKIISLVGSTYLKNDSNNIKKVTRMIDKEVFKLYNISKNDTKVIVDAVDGRLSSKSRW